MKRIFIAITAFLMLVSASAFAGNGEEKVNNKVLNSFEREFKGASDVKWKAGTEVTKADFVLNDFRVEAFFTNDGELLGSSRNVLYNHLPLSVVKAIMNRFDQAPVYDIIEFNMAGETFYYLNVETDTKKLQLKVTQSGDLFVISKTKK